MKRNRTKAEWAAYMREWYRKQREKGVERSRTGDPEKQRQRERRSQDRRRAVLDEIKRTRGCADCCVKNLPGECYDFDHLPGQVKAFQVGLNLRRDWRKVLAEVQKCQVVCANCHRIRTFFRLRAKGQRERGVSRGFVDHLGRFEDPRAVAVAMGLLPELESA